MDTPARCPPIATPSIGKDRDYVVKIMDFNRNLVQNSRTKSRIPMPAVKLQRSQSVRDKPVQGSTFSITKLVEARDSAIKEINSKEDKPQANGDNDDGSSSSLEVSTGSNDEPIKMPVPLLRVPALGKSATFKETKRLTSSCNNLDVTATTSRFLALRAKHQRQMEEERSKEGTIRMENLTRLRLQTFPSVVLQQTPGSYYTSPWNWLRSLNTAVKDQNAEMIWELHQKVMRVGGLLGQIRNDFHFGLNQNDEFVRNVCQEMEVARAGWRGRNTMSVNVLPHMRDIFNGEMNKQKYYSEVLAKPLRSDKDVKRRNQVAKWILRTCEKIGYSAETVHSAVYIVDAYSTGNTMNDGPWSLLGITALHIAAKLEEPKTLYLSHLLDHSSYNVTNNDVYWLEKRILMKLRFDLHPPSAPFLASLVIYGGSLKFPTVNLRKLTLDLTLGILYNSLINYELSLINPADKAKAALEIAVEFIYHQYNHWIHRDMSAYSSATSRVPGHAVGEFALQMCTEVFTQRFAKRDNKLSTRVPTITCNSSPGRDLKAK